MIKQYFFKEVCCDLDKFSEKYALKNFILFLSKHRFLSSLLINGILFSFFLFLFTPRYAINDDPTMMMIASGELLGEPNEYLIFINIIIGHFLKFMYTLLPKLNWYVILFFTCHFFSMVIVLYIFLRNKFSFINILLYLLMFVMVAANFLTNFEFTTTAFVVGISGFLLLLSSGEEALNGKYLILALGIVLLLLSGLIRENVFYALLLLWLPLILYKSFAVKSFQMLIPLVIAVIIFYLANLYDTNYYYQNPDWKFYSQYNSLRANLTDYPHFDYNENTMQVYEAVGWSETNVRMFRAWSFADIEIFPIEDLFYIVENIPATFNDPADIIMTFSYFFNLLDRRILFFTVFIFLIAFITAQKKEPRFLLVAFLMMLVASVYLSHIGRLPPRVFHSLLYSLCIISLYFLTNNINLYFNNPKISASFINITYIILSIVIILVFLVNGLNSKVNLLVQERIDFNLDQLASHNFLYVFWPQPGSFETLISSKEFSVSFVNRFEMNRNKKAIILPLGGSLMHSPHVDRIFFRHSIQNIYLALLEKDDILLIAHPTLVEDLFIKFMEDNYGLSIKAFPVQLTDDIQAFHFSIINYE